MKYDNLFANEYDTQVFRKKLAKHIGLNEAIVLNQLHYWITRNRKSDNNFYDGRYWVYNTYEQWQCRDFEWWSIDTIKRTFTKLEKLGLVISGNYNKMPMDRTKWYSIDYEKLEKMAENIEKSTISANCPDGRGQNAPSNNHRILTENTNRYNSASEMHECDFDLDIVQKVAGITSDKTIIDCFVYYLGKYKTKIHKNHPDVNETALNSVIHNIQAVLQGCWDDVVNENGLRKMIDRHFDTDYGICIDYNVLHFGAEMVLYYQARNVGLICGI